MGKYQRINGADKAPMSSKQKESVKRIVFAWVMAFEAMAVSFGLWAVGFISLTFLIVLASLATCCGMFKTGYFWRDIKF